MKKIIIISALVFELFVCVSAMDIKTKGKPSSDLYWKMTEKVSDYFNSIDKDCLQLHRKKIIRDLQKDRLQVDILYNKLAAVKIVDDKQMEDFSNISFSTWIDDFFHQEIHYNAGDHIIYIYKELLDIKKEVHAIYREFAELVRPSSVDPLISIDNLINDIKIEETSSAAILKKDAMLELGSNLIKIRSNIECSLAAFSCEDSLLFLPELCDFFAHSHMNGLYIKFFHPVMAELLGEKDPQFGHVFIRREALSSLLYKSPQVISDFLRCCTEIIDNCFLDEKYDTTFLYSKVNSYMNFLEKARESSFAMMAIVNIFSHYDYYGVRIDDFFHTSETEEILALTQIFDEVQNHTNKPDGLVEIFVKHFRAIALCSRLCGYDKISDIIRDSDLEAIDTLFNFLAIQESIERACYILNKINETCNIATFMRLFKDFSFGGKRLSFKCNLYNFFNIYADKDEESLKKLMQYILSDRQLTKNFQLLLKDSFSKKSYLPTIVDVTHALFRPDVDLSIKENNKRFDHFLSDIVESFSNKEHHTFLGRSAEEIIESFN